MKKRLTEEPTLRRRQTMRCLLRCFKCRHRSCAETTRWRSNPVAYYSRKLLKHEQNYATTELQYLAIIDAVDKWHCYLHGRPFTLITDQAALQWLKNNKNPQGRLFRWSLKLSMLGVNIRDHKGSDNIEPCHPTCFHTTASRPPTIHIANTRSKMDSPLSAEKELKKSMSLMPSDWDSSRKPTSSLDMLEWRKPCEYFHRSMTGQKLSVMFLHTSVIAIHARDARSEKPSDFDHWSLCHLQNILSTSSPWRLPVAVREAARQKSWFTWR